MRILITGGCGFLGRRLALLLLEKGSALGPIDELVLFDNAPSALPLPDDKRVRLVTGDIADHDTVKALILVHLVRLQNFLWPERRLIRGQRRPPSKMVTSCIDLLFFSGICVVNVV